MTTWLRQVFAWSHLRAASAGLVLAIALTAEVAALGQSWGDLRLWALRYGIPASRAWYWPAVVDFPLLLGELWLFIAVIDRRTGWREHWRTLAWGWLLVTIGLAASVAGNIGNAGWHTSVWSMGTYAMAPVTAGIALGCAMALVKLAAPKTTKTRAGRGDTGQPASRKPAERKQGNPTPGLPGPASPRGAQPPARRGSDPEAEQLARVKLAELRAQGQDPGRKVAAELLKDYGLTDYRIRQIIKEPVNGYAHTGGHPEED